MHKPPPLLIKKFLAATGLLSRGNHLLNRIYPTFESLHPANLGAIIKAIKAAPNGDYYEFGVYKGFSLWFATQIAATLEKNEMRFFGFDSFDGLPAPRGIDKEPYEPGMAFARGSLSASAEQTRKFLAAHGSDLTRIIFVEGFYEDTLLPKLRQFHNMRSAAVVMIDCDLYASTVIVLDFILPLLQAGTILLFDDWHLTVPEKGEQLATREWLARNQALKLEEFCEFGKGKGFRASSLPG